ncbi:MAG TPA: N-6 DNA methylase, partial [Vicinamibacterales bacterium]
MIAGFGGELIAHAYLEEQLASVDPAGQAVFGRRLVRWWRLVSRSLGPASSVRAIHDVGVVPLLLLLDHERPAASPSAAGYAGTVSPAAVLLSIPWSVAPSTAWREAIRLGRETGASWALVSNARSLRIFDCTRTWTRASLEFDFDRLVTSPIGVSALWMLARSAALSGTVTPSLRMQLSASDHHASRVCRSLSDGVLATLPALAGALSFKGTAPGHPSALLDQALTLVYRILFLLFAEARALVPVWNELYRDAYTIDALTRRATRTTAGLWKSLQAISRLAHSGCQAGDLTVTAFNGRLFSPRHAPLVETGRVPDSAIRDALLSLGTEITPLGRRRISYHDLGVEQLGSVYERVLDYEPSHRGAAVCLTRTSTQRKTTGSFYTPQALTEFLVRRTLAPLVAGKSADDILRLRILDPAMGSGAFLVSACRFLADCCEQAQIRDGRWSPDADVARSRATLRRQVAERCLYGVDLNPTAVQLARLSLWLTTLAADRPLTFLDHHLATGNSLVGAWLAELARPPRPTSRSIAVLPLFEDLVADEVAARILPARLRLANEPSESLDVVRNKERSLAALSDADGPLARWTSAADAWCAAALWEGAPPSEGVVNEWIAGATGTATTIPPAMLRAAIDGARRVATAHAAFHWELAF